MYRLINSLIGLVWWRAINSRHDELKESPLSDEAKTGYFSLLASLRF
jgi:hypothetical protein